MSPQRQRVILVSILFFLTTQSPGDELSIVNEVKFEKIIDSKNKIDKYEVSGVHFVNKKFYVVFDNNSRVARVNAVLSKAKLLGKKHKKVGYEGITYDPLENEFYVVEESLKHKNDWNARLSTLDEDLVPTSKEAWLDYDFESGNKGFEGLTVLTKDGTTSLLALCEGNSCKAGKKGKELGRGTIQIFEKRKQKWKLTHTVDLPESLAFTDYSGLDIRNNTLAVTSQESSALWVGKLDADTWRIVGDGKVYRFPKNKKGETTYCNVEGVSWINENELVVVSDAKKDSQPKACKKKEQSIHIVSLKPFF